jgi:signal transduction histidine kinase
MYSHQTTLYHAVLITALTLGIIISYFLLSLYRQQRRYQQVQRSYFARDINLLEEERSRVGRDLHDDVGLLVSVVKSYIGEVEGRTKEDKHYLEKTEGLLDRMRNRLGEIAADLGGGRLERKGLRYVIDKFLYTRQRTKETQQRIFTCTALCRSCCTTQ